MSAIGRARRLGGRGLGRKQEALIHDPLTILQIYDEILIGNRSKFPKWTLTDEYGNPNFDNLTRLTKYLIEEVLIPSKDYPEIRSLSDVPEKVKNIHFSKNKLSGILKVFRGSAFNAIKSTYKTIDGIELKDYYFKDKKGKWMKKDGTKNLELAREATREFIGILMKKNNWALKDIPEKITIDHFAENILPFHANLYGMMDIFNYSTADVVINAYPEIDGIKLKPYYFKHSQSNTWTSKDGKKNYHLAGVVTREYIENLLKKEPGLRFKDLPNWIRYDHFERRDILPFNAGMEGMMVSVFKGSPCDAIMNAYPKINGIALKPYYFSKVPNYRWISKDGVKNYKLIAQATREFFSLLSKKYKIDFIKNPDRIRWDHFFKEIMPFRSSLGGMISSRAYHGRFSDFKEDFPMLIKMSEDPPLEE